VVATIFGHQGGWDEALMVLVPIGLFVGLLMIANRRAKAIQSKRMEERETAQPLDPSSNSSSGEAK